MGHEMRLVDCNQDFFEEEEKYSDTVTERNTVFLDLSTELEGANMKIFYLCLPV